VRSAAARRRPRTPDHVSLERLAKQFFTAIQAIIETPWGVAQSDFVYPATRGLRPADFGQRMQYNIALLKLAAWDPEVHKLMAEVSQLLKPSSGSVNLHSPRV
jgi:hypothetical protein